MQEFKVLMKTFVPNNVDYLEAVGADLENAVQELISGYYRVESTTTNTSDAGTETVMDCRFTNEQAFEDFHTMIVNDPLTRERFGKCTAAGITKSLEVIGYINI